MRSSRLLAATASCLLASLALGQGSLTPPGAPAPTGRTLDQVQPRTPISASTSITQPGSYYLTANITVATGNGLSISADNVTLDLNGFTISSTSASAGFSGILVAASAEQVVISNGHILGGTTFSGGVFSGGGFVSGITALTARNVRVTDVSVLGVASHGINLNTAADAGTTIAGCTVRTAGTSGLRANVVTNSAALQIGGTAAIEAATVTNSFGTLTGTTGTPIAAARIAAVDGRTRIPARTTTYVISQPGSYVLDGPVAVTSGDGIRIEADDVTLDLNGFAITSTTISPAAGAGVLLVGVRSNIVVRNGHVRGGAVYSGTGATFTEAGFLHGVTVDSYGSRNVLIEKVTVSQTRLGIYLSRPNNPVAPEHTSIVRACSVQQVSRTGIVCAIVQESAAEGCGDYAISASTAVNTIGQSYGSAGLLADNATNCQGIAAGGSPGLQVTVAENCSGRSNSGIGLQASQASNSYGQSNTGTGISAYTATNCFGSSSNATSISATIGVSCRGFVSTGGNGLALTNRYLMP